MNGQVNGNAGTSTERVFRAHDRPTLSAPEFAAIQRGYLERLGTIVDQLSTIVRRLDMPTTTVGSTTADVSRTECGRHAQDDFRLAMLTSRTLADGVVGYSLPSNPLSSIISKLTGTSRIAFIHNCAGTRSASVEIVGRSHRAIVAAMGFAAELWAGNELTIDVDGPDAGRIVEHAVAQRLKIANRDPYFRSLVNVARKRLEVRVSDAATRPRVAVIKRTVDNGSLT